MYKLMGQLRGNRCVVSIKMFHRKQLARIHCIEVKVLADLL